MFLKTALVLLVSWLLGVIGVYRAGTLVHVLLLAGLMFLFLGLLNARDAAAGRETGQRRKE